MNLNDCDAAFAEVVAAVTFPPTALDVARTIFSEHFRLYPSKVLPPHFRLVGIRMLFVC